MNIFESRGDWPETARHIRQFEEQRRALAAAVTGSEVEITHLNPLPAVVARPLSEFDAPQPTLFDQDAPTPQS